MAEESSPEGTIAARPRGRMGGVVPERQWGLPVGFDARGEKTVTLLELVEGTPAILPQDGLSGRQRAELVSQRIRGQNKFALSMYGVEGVIDKERAVSEVVKGSKVGNAIAQVELFMIEEMIALAKGEEPPR